MLTGSSGDTSGCRTCVGGEVALAASGAGAVGSAATGVQRRWTPKGSETSTATLESWNWTYWTLDWIQNGATRLNKALSKFQVKMTDQFNKLQMKLDVMNVYTAALGCYVSHFS